MTNDLIKNYGPIGYTLDLDRGEYVATQDGEEVFASTFETPVREFCEDVVAKQRWSCQDCFVELPRGTGHYVQCPGCGGRGPDFLDLQDEVDRILNHVGYTDAACEPTDDGGYRCLLDGGTRVVKIAANGDYTEYDA
jgi:hypothetical protein